MDIVTTKDEAAAPVIKKQRKITAKTTLAPNAELYGQYLIETGGKRWLVEYKPDSNLRDTEQVPLLEPDGIEGFFRREALPHVPDAWIDEEKTVIGYEIPFTRHFYQYQPLRPVEEIIADIRALEAETEGLLDKIVDGLSKETGTFKVPVSSSAEAVK